MGTSDQLAAMKAAKAEAILNEGLAFLESNKNKPGVIVLPSGLQYEIITEGSGAKPTASQTVTCHYHGTLTNGTVFDSSVKRGAPASFPLNRVISGWTEALQLMPVGSKWRLFLPPQLAYGSMQVGAIPANSTLIFEVELLGIA
jgi:FKBP-type peptidyl-prolyl cis-trans isomerase FklB